MAKTITVPKFEDLGLSGARCDKVLVEFGVKALLDGLAGVPEERREAVIRDKMADREALIETVRGTLLHDANQLAWDGKIEGITDLSAVAATVVNTVLDAVAVQLED